jgi:hypothetical protein
MIECLHGMHETLASIPNTAKIKKKLKIKKRMESVFSCVFETESCHTAQAGLELCPSASASREPELRCAQPLPAIEKESVVHRYPKVDRMVPTAPSCGSKQLERRAVLPPSSGQRKESQSAKGVVLGGWLVYISPSSILGRGTGPIVDERLALQGATRPGAAFAQASRLCLGGVRPGVA